MQVGGAWLCHLRINHAANATGLLGELSSLGAWGPHDLVLLNFGLWYAKGEAHERDGIGESGLARDVGRLAEYYSAHRGRLPALIWHNTSPQHFRTPHGGWECSG